MTLEWKMSLRTTKSNMAFEPMIIIGLKLAYLVRIMLKMGVFEKSKTYFFFKSCHQCNNGEKKVKDNKL